MAKQVNTITKKAKGSEDQAFKGPGIEAKKVISIDDVLQAGARKEAAKAKVLTIADVLKAQDSAPEPEPVVADPPTGDPAGAKGDGK